MLKASALYLVIVIALVMAVICSSMIVAAYFYREQYQRTFRSSQLQNNLASAINVLLESKDDFTQGTKISLFGNRNDTVLLQRKPWGLYTVATAQALIQQDTLAKSFTMAQVIDSASWAALYVIDEDRSLSVSGKTKIKGDAYLPKAGIQEAYVNNQAYQGNKQIVEGRKKESKRTLPVLNDVVLQQLQQSFKVDSSNIALQLPEAPVHRSFLQPTLTFAFGKQVQTVTGKLEGNIILQSDTTLVVDAQAELHNVLIYAKAISVKSGFHGNCQLFARDSINIEANCTFDYPSAIGALRSDNNKTTGQVKLSLGDNTRFNGALFTYEKAKNDLMPYLSIGKNSTITGQVYSQGLFNYKDALKINGSIYTSRFLYQTAYTRYENYLINLEINSPALSRYYLTTELLPSAAPQKKILQWLDTR
ncbi:hypothetical protein [Mucilaginibacter lacusdianchii]|uniref:hypothetical protein n=1 Tax=Mucilaginibacter lacusdianchii TaxID=2684211 RepID=UPI00131E89BD|nr:hypothetical protein [Mucilaginibacter sp. JXJ CY 39]